MRPDFASAASCSSRRRRISRASRRLSRTFFNFSASCFRFASSFIRIRRGESAFRVCDVASARKRKDVGLRRALTGLPFGLPELFGLPRALLISRTPWRCSATRLRRSSTSRLLARIFIFSVCGVSALIICQLSSRSRMVTRLPRRFRTRPWTDFCAFMARCLQDRADLTPLESSPSIFLSLGERASTRA